MVGYIGTRKAFPSLIKGLKYHRKLCCFQRKTSSPRKYSHQQIADCSIEFPETIECLDLLITTVPLQLPAYHIAVCKGMDVGQPRNLAKSVTVE